MAEGNTCVCCGRIIPEGTMICLQCGSENEMQTFRTKVRTNGDKIRAMTDEELAQFLCQINTCSTCPFASIICKIGEWLREEAQDNG